MKHKVSFFAILMMALALPQSVLAYDFSAVAPTGQTLYYNIVSGNAQVMGGDQPGGDLVIPDSVFYNGVMYVVRSISSHAFSNNSNLTSVIIPASISTIGEYAFAFCNNLKTISVFALNIGEYAFYCSGDNCKKNIFLQNCYPPYDVPTSAIGYNQEGESFHIHQILVPASCIDNYDGLYYMAKPDVCDMTVTNANPNMGTIRVADSVAGNHYNLRFGDTIFFTAEPIEHHHFVKWSYSYYYYNTAEQTIQNYNSSVYVLGRGEIHNELKAYFAIDIHTVSAASSNTAWGVVSGGGDYEYHAPCTLTATAYTGYRFLRWSNGVSANPYIFPVTEDVELTAVFVGENDIVYTLTTESANPTMGTVTGGGNYEGGASATLTAMPNAGYHFVRWQDGNTQNPRTITVTSDATYTAYFEADASEDDCPAVSSFPWNATFDEELTCWKTVDADGDGYNWKNYEDYVVSESYSYFDGTNRGLTPDNWLISRRIQVPASGNYSLSWMARGMSEDYYRENYSVYVSTTGDNPSNFTTQLFSETLNTPDAVSRSKSLDSYRGQTIRIAFRHHNTNDVFVLGVGNVKISQDTQGIDDINECGIAVYATSNQIHISGTAGECINVFSIDGRTVASVPSSSSKVIIPMENAGVYIVKVGDHTARKVVVIR